MDLLNVVWQALLAFVVLFIISLILGKKQVAQLEFSDYVVGISIGSIAAQMAIDSEVPFYHFIVAMAIFGGLDLIITLISRKSNILKVLFKGKPLILIYNGTINYNNLVKSKLDYYDLVAQCRNAGYFYIEDIAFCIFENSGKFSILPKSNARQVQSSDFNLPEQPVRLQTDVIIDGKIIENALNKLNKDKAWLLKKLKISNKKQLKNIFLAIYDEDTKKFSVHTKK